VKKTDFTARVRHIRLVVLDVDGVLTDGSILLDADGREMKQFNVHDGTGIKYLQRADLGVAILSGRRARAVTHRARELDIRPVLQGYKFKADGLRRLLRETKLPAEAMAFVGDDLPDIPVMRAVGLAVAVADARPEVRAAAHWVTRTPGGRGAVREVAERILRLQGRWADIIARYGLTPSGGPEAP
jgi:3-deoxy-D-manno-octulosonate 8-phosphate phosphatase (KDO 8-P phosphatase)